jgi:hypothetical protein
VYIVDKEIEMNVYIHLRTIQWKILPLLPK